MSPDDLITRWSRAWLSQVRDEAVIARLARSMLVGTLDPMVLADAPAGDSARLDMHLLFAHLLKYGIDDNAPIRQALLAFRDWTRGQEAASVFQRALFALDRLQEAVRLGAALPAVPPEIVRAARAGRLVVVVGPRLAKLPPEVLAQRLIEGLDPPEPGALTRNPVGAQTRLRHRLPAAAERRARIHALLVAEDAVDDHGALPALAAIAALPNTPLVTVNADRLLERVAGDSLPVILASDASPAHTRGRRLLKARGDLGRPESIHDLPLGPWLVGTTSPPAWRAWIAQQRAGVLWLFAGFRSDDAASVWDELAAQDEGRVPYGWFLPMEPPEERALPTDNVIELVNVEHTTAWLQHLAERIAHEQTHQELARVESLRGSYAEGVSVQLRERRQAALALTDPRAQRDALVGLREEALRLAVQDPDLRWRRWLAQCTLDAAIAHGNLQEHDTARKQVEALEDDDMDALAPQVRAKAAEFFARSGESARAARWLPPVADGAQEDAQTRASRWRVALAAGAVPDGAVPDDPFVRTDLAWHRLREGRIDDAVTLALPHCDDVEPALAFTAASSLVEAFVETIWRDDAPEPLAGDFARRSTLVAAIDRTFARLLRSEPPTPAFSLALWRNYHVWAVLALHASQVVAAVDKLRSLGAEAQQESTIKDGAPAWHRAYRRAKQLKEEGRVEESRSLVEETLRVYPGRVPLESHHAQLLWALGRVADAVAPAERAFLAFPSERERGVFANILCHAGQAARAWALVGEAFRGHRVLQWATTRAQIAGAASPGDAAEAWGHVRTLRPHDVEPVWNQAVALFHGGDPSGAAEVMWQLIELPGRRSLTLRELQVAENLLRHGDAPSLPSRVDRILQLLGASFGHDPDAEAMRYRLLAERGFPEGHRAVDHALVAQSSTVEVIDGGAEAIVERFTARRQLREGLLHLYRSGHIPFETLCEHGGAPAPRVLVGMLEEAESGRVVLNAPLRTAERAVTPSLSGRHLLLSELELDLLVHFHLLDRLVQRLGADGRLVLFDDAPGTLASSLDRTYEPRHADELAAWERFERALSQERISLDGGLDPSTDAQRARSLAFALVTTQRAEDVPGVTLVSPAALAERIRPEVTEAVWERLRDEVEDEKGEAPESLPQAALLHPRTLRMFYEAGALSALRAVFPRGLMVGPEGARWLHDATGRLRLATQAADLARRVHGAVGALRAAGMVVLCVRPEVDLPEVREASSEALQREPLRRVLQVRRVLAQNPEWLVLTMDGVVAAPWSSTSLFAGLRWPSREALAAWIDLAHSTDDRVIHLGDLLPVLGAPDEVVGWQTELARMGALDVLTAKTLVALARMQHGLDGTRMRRVLDAIERSARATHDDAPANAPALRGPTDTLRARYRLADLYSGAMLHTLDEPITEPLQGRVVTNLLDRLAALDPHASHQMVARMVKLFVLGCLQRVEAWYRPAAEVDHVALSPDAPIAALWAFVRRWALPQPERRRAVERGLRGAILFLDEHAGQDPVGPVSGILAWLVGDPSQEGGLVSFCDGALGALVTQAAVWSENPLERRGPHARVSAEAMLREVAARVVRDDAEVRRGVRAIVAPVTLPDEGGAITVEVPPEALLLRAPPELVEGNARGLADAVGPLDGSLQRCLDLFASTPSDVHGRRMLARVASAAAFRRIAECPELLDGWGAASNTLDPGLPRSLDDLREMLSEPPGGLASASLLEQVQSRWAPDGIWSRRNDRAALAELACATPGDLAVLAASVRRTVNLQKTLEDAMTRLDDPSAQPIGTLCVDLLTLTWAARKERHAAIGGHIIDLQSRLHDAWVRAFRAEHPETSSREGADAPLRGGGAEPLAAVEASILGVCRAVVARLGGEHTDRRDGVWLTWRLFGWLMKLAAPMNRKARQAWLQAIGRLDCSGATPAVPVDRLDPAGFGAWPHRLGALLYAYLRADALTQEIDAVEARAHRPAIVAAELAATFAALANEPLPSATLDEDDDRADRSVLGWQAPTTLPELALRCLIALDRRAFLEVSAERRLLWILRLERDASGRAGLQRAAPLVGAVVACMKDLTREEQLAFGAFLDTQADDDHLRLSWRLAGNALLVASGHRSRVESLRRDLHLHPEHPMAVEAFGVLLSALSQERPEAMREEVVAMLSASGRADPVPFALAPTRLVHEGGREQVEAATRWLRELPAMYPDHVLVTTSLAALGIV